ncbi:MAG TPA: hypothetical protein P5544_12905 [Candidatus Nanopelagicales bacterium]|nr:hypothetical protein [Candidatus Nanopelagicales bacterium]
MSVEQARAVIVTFTKAGTPYRASGFHVRGDVVLTAGHIAGADGEAYAVECAGEKDEHARLSWSAEAGSVDIGLLTVTGLPPVTPVNIAALNDTYVGQLDRCSGMCFPFYEKGQATQLDGYIPLGDGYIPLGNQGAPSGKPRYARLQLTGHGPAVNEQMDAAEAWRCASGGAVTVPHDGVDYCVGVVSQHQDTHSPKTILLSTFDLLRPEISDSDSPISAPDRHRFWEVLGQDPHGLICLPLLPNNGSQTPEDNLAGPDDLRRRRAGAYTLVSPQSLELSGDLFGRYGSLIESTGAALPNRWTTEALSSIALPTGPSRARDIIEALLWALEAKVIVANMGAERVGLARLQVIYRRSVGAWPADGSLDLLLAQAAEVEVSERRSGSTGELGALARFVIGIASARKVPPDSDQIVAAWLQSRGYQVADAQWNYEAEATSRAWLLLDLGPERQACAVPQGPSAPPWPTRIAWTHVVVRRNEAPTTCSGVKEATPTSGGLFDALNTIVESLPPAHSLLVDLALPVGLLEMGIEHWGLFPESLRERHSARLRWSQRLHDNYLLGQCLQRTKRSDWNVIPSLLADTELADEAQLRRWIREDTRHAWLIARRPHTNSSDPLRMLLRAGYGFLIWFPGAAPPEAQSIIVSEAKKITTSARRLSIPDILPEFSENPITIWDDPRGREDEFPLNPRGLLASF